MKRINILLSIAIAVILAACSGSSLERMAKQRYKEIPMGAFQDTQASVDISDEKVIFSDDSICVLQFTVNLENYSGSKVQLRMEYFILRTEERKDKPSSVMESTYVINEDRYSLLDQEVIFYKNINKPKPKDVAERRRKLRMLAILFHQTELRTVDE